MHPLGVIDSSLVSDELRPTSIRLARRSSGLPRLEAAHFSGRISWSMALEVVAFATPRTKSSCQALAAHDSDDNVITLCTRCHLEGVHGGRITVTRENGSLVWRFGKHTVVIDRDRYRAA